MCESSSSGQYQKLPPGWDCKFDQTTGNCYYINYFTKAMQLEDPRIRYKQLQNERCSTESIPLQPLHGSPYHVYPSNNLPAIRAFQAGPVSHANAGWQHMSSSPLLSSRGNLEMSPLPFPKLAVTQTPRLGSMSRRSTIQETSFSNHIDTDAVVTKIQNMFPTASENHIRLLLRRYYNREAVVISALQVEKHPVTMPGPFVTPPAQRHLFHSNSAFQMTPPSRRLDIGHSAVHSAFGIGSGNSRTASPLPGGRFGSVNSMNSSGRGAEGITNGSGFVGFSGTGTHSYPATSSVLFHGSPRFGEQWRSSPKPHSSPKMKLRYMKNIFPKADEMLLLDVLAGADNNVQKASQTLISMGYAKRDFITQKPVATRTDITTGVGSEGNAQEHKSGNEQIIPLQPKEYTQEEKETIQKHFKEKYSQIAERIIIMALESVNYSEDRAIQILQIVQQEENVQRAKSVQAANAAECATAHMGLLPSTLECSEIEPIAENVTCAPGTDGVDNIITVVVEETQTTVDHKINDRDQNICNAVKSNDNDDKIYSKHVSDEHNVSENINTSLIATTTTSTLSTSPSSSLIASKNPLKMKKLAFPSINVTTPTTATTQIILSNSPIYLENETATMNLLPTTVETQPIGTEELSANKPHIDKPNNEDRLISKSSTPENMNSTSLSSPTSKPLTSFDSSSSFQTITVRSMLSRSNNTARRGHISSSFSSDNSANAYGTASLLEKLKLTSRPRYKSETLKYAQRDSNEDEVDDGQKHEFKSILGRIATMGPNNELSKGPDESLLLADYVTWNGANPDISAGQKHLAVGSDSTLLSERSYAPHGRNTELCKGPKVGLAKGSIYAQLTAAKGSKSANIKCN